MNNYRSVWVLLAVTGCVLESGKEVPPVKGAGSVTVDPATQKVTLDTSKIPEVQSCAAGQVVRRTADGWECAEPNGLPVAWQSVTGRPATTEWSSIVNVPGQWPGTVPLARVESASDVVNALGAQLDFLMGKVTALDAATEILRAQVTAQAGRALALESATDALQSQVTALKSRALALEAATDTLWQMVNKVTVPGTIMAYAGDNTDSAGNPLPPPPGWLWCDGSTELRSDHPRLFAAIGTSHGAGPTNLYFLLPDYRGRFLRGVDGGAGRDPDKAARTAAAAGGATGNKVGSVQGHELASHFHYAAQKSGVPSGTTLTAFSDWAAFASSVTPYTASAGGNETRPTNAYVNWIIKY